MGGYRLVGCLGRGWESTSYLATELHSRVARRLKFFRQPSLDLAYPGHVAATFEALAPTGAVAAYHHLGIWQRGPSAVPFLVFGYVDGQPLSRLLAPGRWRRNFSERFAVRVLADMAGKLAAAHSMGLAIGDFGEGNNVLVRADGGAIWIDLDAGEAGKPNADMAADGWDFFTVVDRMAAHQPCSPLLTRVAAKLERFRERKRWKGAFQRIADILLDAVG